MKTISTAFTRPRTSSGRHERQDRRAEDDAHHVERAPERQREHREPHRAREPEDDHAGAEARYDEEQRRPGAPSDRVAGDDERRDERADRRRRAEEPEPGRADLEDVLREDRQQRDRAAEEHGEEVERDRAEQDVRSPDETNAGEHLVDPDGTFRRRLAATAKREHAPERDQRERDRDGVDELGLDREEDPADRRARRLPRAGRRSTAARAR